MHVKDFQFVCPSMDKQSHLVRPETSIKSISRKPLAACPSIYFYTCTKFKSSYILLALKTMPLPPEIENSTWDWGPQSSYIYPPSTLKISNNNQAYEGRSDTVFLLSVACQVHASSFQMQRKADTMRKMHAAYLTNMYDRNTFRSMEENTVILPFAVNTLPILFPPINAILNPREQFAAVLKSSRVVTWNRF